MSWIQKCVDTYDNNAALVGVEIEGKATLTPMYFITQKAHLEVTITEDGKFESAVVIDKENPERIIPATEKSSTRCNVCAHPLCDQLRYVALGHPNYPEHEKYAKEYKSYIELISKWANSDYSHFIVNAVYRYCLNGTLVKDLVSCGIAKCNENGILSTSSKDKINGDAYNTCLVVWRVKKEGEVGESWLSQSLFNSFYNFYTSDLFDWKYDICYVTGEKTRIANKHPKGIVRFEYGAKLISTNDLSGFTYRGRFDNAEQAISVGADVSQKAHNALSWIIANQGISLGKKTFVCWNPNGKPIPKINELVALDGKDSEELISQTKAKYAVNLRYALKGYASYLDDNDDIIVMTLEAGTPGRLSITYYNEIKASDFLSRLNKWAETCCWYFPKYDDEGSKTYPVLPPTVDRAIKFAFGIEKDGKVQVNKGIMESQSNPLLSCVLDGTSIPHSLVTAIFNKVSYRECYSNDNYETLLATCCAVLKKYKHDKGEETQMELDVNNTSRSYLFGRLLAVAEKAEQTALLKDGHTRQPNAARLQAQFAATPLRTWRVLEQKLIPYLEKLSPKTRNFYKKTMSDIVATLTEIYPLSRLNAKLDNDYVIGYYLQRRELYKKKEKENEANSTDSLPPARDIEV